MSSITTLSISSWAQAQISSLYESNNNSNADDSTAEFQTLFDATFGSGAQLFLNHKLISRDELKEDLRSRSFAATRSSVAWGETIELPGEGNASATHEAGIVAGSFTVTNSLKFRIRAAPAQTINHVIFSAMIEQDSMTQSEDRRRIVHMFLTSVNNASPIHLHSST